MMVHMSSCMLISGSSPGKKEFLSHEDEDPGDSGIDRRPPLKNLNGDLFYFHPGELLSKN